MTNGYNATVVLPAMQRIGWLQPGTKGYDIVDCDNRESASGRYYNDDSFHAASLIENIYDCQPNPAITEEDFNTYLGQLRTSVILSALNAVFDAPQFIASGLLFRKVEATARNPITNRGNFCGLKLKVSQGDYGVTLQNALLLFNGVKTFNLYLFNSLTNGTDTISNAVTDVPYIKKWQVTTKANSQTIVPLNYTINNSNDTVKGGEWFLGYFQDDLGTVKALDYYTVRNQLNIVSGISFESKAAGNDFDREVYGQSAGMYGLNLELSAYRDRTNTIVNNAHLFDNLQGLMMSAKIIELVQNTIRANIKQRISKENLALLYRDLNQVTTEDNAFSPGLKSQVQQEVKRLREAFFKPSCSITVTNPVCS